MDNTKVGELIRRLRKESHMTQLQLAEELHVSDKAISKWERGMGCPDHRKRLFYFFRARNDQRALHYLCWADDI